MTDKPRVGGFCPACTAGLHVKCDDRMDFAFGTKTAGNPCGCGCFNGTETSWRALQDMIVRNPDYAAQWLLVHARIQGSLHVCGKVRSTARLPEWQS